MLRILMMIIGGLCLVTPDMAVANVHFKHAQDHDQAQEMRRKSGSRRSTVKKISIKKTVVNSRSTRVTIVNRRGNQTINNTTQTTVIRPAAAAAPVAAGAVAATSTARASTAPKRPVCPSDLERFGTIQSGTKTIDVCRSPQGICTLARTAVTVDCSSVKRLSL